MPCVAKHLLRLVLSITPGNLFALKTWNTWEKQLARTGADPLFKLWGEVGEPTLTKFIFNRKLPSVLTLRSCKINHTPITPSGSVSLKALTQRLPIKLRVNIPLGAARGSLRLGAWLVGDVNIAVIGPVVFW